MAPREGRLPGSERGALAAWVAERPRGGPDGSALASLSRGQTAVLGEIVNLITPDHPELDEATRRSTRDDVTRYLASQIQSMPGHLRLPFKLAILAFDWLPLLRYLRRFGALAPKRQQAYLTLWSDGPIGPMRDFVKLIRSSGLFVYYDHPRVIERLLEESKPRPLEARPSVLGSRR